MNANDHIAVEDLALLALLLLSEEEAGAVRAHMRECTLCTEEFGRVREDLARYALAVEPVVPPVGARDRFAASLGRDETTAAKPVLVESAGSRPRRSIAAHVLTWAGWAAAAAAIVIALGLKENRDSLRAALSTQHAELARYEAREARARRIVDALSDPAAVRVTLAVPKAAKEPEARATYQQKSGTLLLQAGNLQPLAPAKVYELWLIPADGGAPIAAGTFTPDAHGNANLLVPSLPGAIAAKAFGITAEPAGGSPTPTMPILLVGSPA